jgi:hypothetical protein
MIEKKLKAEDNRNVSERGCEFGMSLSMLQTAGNLYPTFAFLALMFPR